jgi:hypothetical protein
MTPAEMKKIPKSIVPSASIKPMRTTHHFQVICFLIVSASFLLAGCGPSVEAQVSMTFAAETITAEAWTSTWTHTPTFTFTPSSTYTPSITPTPTSTPTDTLTPTITFTPTFTNTPTYTPSPTFDYPKVVVNKALAACLFGPSKEYLWARDLKQGDTGIIWGRAPNGVDWFYVQMEKWPQYPCWVSHYVVDVTGDPNKMIVETVRLPITNALYRSPAKIRVEREDDQVTISWEEIWMTVDDDRGYFLDLWVCQNGNYVWVPKHMENQYETTFTVTDQPGCPWPSKGQIYTVEKHGYTSPNQIPWLP